MIILYAILLVSFTSAMSGQEIKSIDLTLVAQRTELRHPAAVAPASDCKLGTSCVEEGSGGGSVADGAPDRRDPHALGVYLQSVTPTDIDPAKPFEAEFRVLNTGLAPIELPISPHLSDLQPSDASVRFSYLSLALVVNAEALMLKQVIGFVELYGSPDREETTLMLRPGQWITVRANVKLRSSPSEEVATRFHAEFWLRRNTFQPHPGGEFTEMQNLYPNATSTPGIPVHLLHQASADNSEQ